MVEREFSSGVETPLGWIKVVASIIGIKSISFQETPTMPAETGTFIEEAISQLREFFSGQRTSFSLPLDLPGTAFEQNVWNALQGIPFGSTCSYSDIAYNMKNPNAVRAVGRANGANPIPIIIPCHRVVGSDGSLTGYSGGLWRKRWLLDYEARIAGYRLF